MRGLSNEINRGTGRTTRLIDAYIQDIFRYGSVEVRDHEPVLHCHRDLALRIQNRMLDEHRIDVDIRIDKDHVLVTRKNK